MKIGLSLADRKIILSAYCQILRNVECRESATTVYVVVVLQNGRSPGAVFYAEPTAPSCIRRLGPGILTLRDHPLQGEFQNTRRISELPTKIAMSGWKRLLHEGPTLVSILTDLHLWVPVVILILGIALLMSMR